jgi:hypothetical protein
MVAFKLTWFAMHKLYPVGPQAKRVGTIEEYAMLGILACFLIILILRLVRGKPWRNKTNAFVFA